MKHLLPLSAIFLFASSSCTQTTVSTSVPKPVPTPVIVKEQSIEVVVSDIPKETWEPIYHQSIQEIGRSVGIRPLRTQQIADNDIEVRIWMGFGITQLRGFVLKRTGAKWSAFHIGSPVGSSSIKDKMSPLSTPKSGWKSAWDSMLQQDILTLPDAAGINCESMYDDGFSYVVEILKGKNYRTYMYDNPSEKFDNRCSQADKILAIADIISKDYGIEGF